MNFGSKWDNHKLVEYAYEIAERDINYWYDEAQKDEWLQTLINMANKYKLKYKLSNDNIENINILENILTHYLRKIILI